MLLGERASALHPQVPGLVPGTMGSPGDICEEAHPGEHHTLKLRQSLYSFRPQEGVLKCCFAVSSAFKMRGCYFYVSEGIHVSVERSESTTQKELTQNTQGVFVQCSSTCCVSSWSPGRGSTAEISWVEAQSVLLRCEKARLTWKGQRSGDLIHV